MLVAPVTTPGNVTSERVWFPPGTWTDWFTGATFQGPSTQTLTVRDAPLTLRVYPGAPGRALAAGD